MPLPPSRGCVSLTGDTALTPRLASLSQLLHLQELALLGGPFHGLDSLQHLTHLQLDFSDSNARFDGTCLFRTRLRQLELYDSELVHMDGGVGTCTALERLACVRSMIDAQAVEKSLITLDAGFRLPAVITTLTLLTSLELSLSLVGVPDGDATQFELLSHLTKLCNLNLHLNHGCAVPKTLSTLTKLTSLSFCCDCEQLTGAIRFDLD